MSFDSENEIWSPAHGREVRLRGMKALFAALALMAVATAFTAGRPMRKPAPKAVTVSQTP